MERIPQDGLPAPKGCPKSSPHRDTHSPAGNGIEGDTNSVWAHLEEISSTPRAEDEEARQGRQATSLKAGRLSKESCSPCPQKVSATDASSSTYGHVGKLMVQLPNVYTARLLLQHYIQIVDILHRELHVPSTRTLLEATYTQLSNSHPVSREVLALFFSIFASSAFHICQGSSHSRCAELQSTTTSYGIWKDIALNLLLQKDLVVSKTLLSLQAICILIYLVWDSEGQSPTYNTLRGIAYTKAFQMKIHRLDAGDHPLDEDIIQVELKRRLWWCLASTDW
jgi:hypothetical protein